MPEVVFIHLQDIHAGLLSNDALDNLLVLLLNTLPLSFALDVVQLLGSIKRDLLWVVLRIAIFKHISSQRIFVKNGFISLLTVVFNLDLQ